MPLQLFSATEVSPKAAAEARKILFKAVDIQCPEECIINDSVVYWTRAVFSNIIRLRGCAILLFLCVCECVCVCKTHNCAPHTNCIARQFLVQIYKNKNIWKKIFGREKKRGEKRRGEKRRGEKRRGEKRRGEKRRGGEEEGGEEEGGEEEGGRRRGGRRGGGRRGGGRRGEGRRGGGEEEGGEEEE